MRLKRCLPIILALLVLVAGGPSGLVPGLGGAALAQQNQQRQQLERRPNLLELLFGGGLRKQRLERQRPKADVRRVIVEPKPKRNRRAAAPAAVASQPAQKQVVEKVENAAKVLVVGDFMADGLHFGLEQSFAENPNVVFLNEASGLSGLVRDDVVDWPVKTGELIDEKKPVAVLVLVGMNDRQQMRTPAGRAEKLSDPWKTEYEARVEALVAQVRARNLTLVWLGLPPVKSGAMNSDYLVFNEIYRNKVEAAGGRFVDVWDGFTNAEGEFVSAGPDVNGQIVRLRNSDGINMTRAAKAKLAFYAEKELRRLLGIGAEAQIASLGAQGPVQVIEPEYDPALSGRTIVVSFDSPQVDGGDVLEGGEGFLEDDELAVRSTSYALVTKGAALQPHDGRVDAAWGLPSAPEVKTVEDLKAQGVAAAAAGPSGPATPVPVPAPEQPAAN